MLRSRGSEVRVIAATLPRGSQLFIACALVALASTFVLPLSNPDFAGWRLDHGHMTLSPVVPHHSHAWEHSHSEAEHSQDDRVVTTNGDLGSMPGIGHAWAPAPTISSPVAPIEFEALEAPRSPAPALAAPPLTPPPRV